MSVLLADLSNNNEPEPDWQAFKRDGVVGVWLKASEGESFTDRTFAHRRRDAHEAGLHVGAYHFGSFSFPALEAIHFCRTVGPLRPGDLLPALDLEVPSTRDAAAKVAWARSFNHEVKRRLGHFPLFYSFRAYIDGLDAKVPIGAGLWLADFGPDDGHPHPATAPRPWKHLKAHQFTQRGHVAGYGPVDLSTAPALAPLLART